MTEREPLVKTLEEADIITSGLTSTQFEGRRVVMDSSALSSVSAAGKQCVSLVMVTTMSWIRRSYVHPRGVRVVHYGII